MDAVAIEFFASAYALIYFGAFAAVAAWESLSPRRVLLCSLRQRWLGNIGITFLNSLVVWTLFPAFTVGFALVAQEHGWGLLRYADVPWPAAFAVALLALDFAHYALHRAFHTVPLLWRAHRMHHTDQDYDLTTGLRFHPLEVVLGALVAFAVIAGLGAPVAAVALYELCYAVIAVFAHANGFLPLSVDRLLRWVVVTPDLHRVHHSAVPAETDSNFGGITPWWDRLLGTFKAQPAVGHDCMTIGLADHRGPEHLRLPRMLLDPFLPHPATATRRRGTAVRHG